jgi:radical SAM superfamily enzyme YgiQ (UPF0313 family)
MKKSACRTGSDFSLWYEREYPDLTGNGLWLRGNELNTLDPEEYEKRSFRILIARLSTYFDTAGSFSHKILYQIARRQRSVFPDFSYLPPLHDGPVFSRDTVPWLLGTATKQGPGGFDIIAFSNSIVQELVNVPLMLEKSGIPLEKSRRLADDSVPLIILGGSNSLFTSVFFVDEPPVDGIFFGESTDCIARIFALCAEAKDAGLSKAETLTRLESVPGFILPDRPRTTKRFIDPAPSMNELLEGAPVFNLDGQFGTGNLQISEGCPCFCGFCAESFCRKPYREVAAGRALDEAAGMKAGMGLDKIELFSFNFNMHSGFYDILAGLSGLFATVGLKSQRFDGIAADPGLLDLCIAAGKTSITCGLEGISARLRRFLHKSLTEKDLHASLSLVLSAPVRELKVFLIVTGKEDRHDLEEFNALLRFIKESTVGRSSHGPRLIFSTTPLVRFPWTPLEFDDAPQPEALRPVIAAIRGTVEAGGYEFRLSSDINDYYLSQMLVRAADPRIYGGLLSALRSTGYAYYRAVPTSFINEFVRECVARGLSFSSLLAPQAADGCGAPWLFFQTGVSRDFIRRQAEAADACVDNGFCLGTAGRQGECKACNACGGDTDHKSAITAQRHGVKGRFQPFLLKEKNKKAAASTLQVPLLVEINDSCRGLPRATIAVALASAIMKSEPTCIPWYRGFVQSFQSPGNGPCWTTGDDIITLLWLHNGIAALEAIVRDPERLTRVNLLFEKWGSLKAFQPQEPERYRLTVQSPFRFEPKNYFAGRGLTHTLRKSADGYFCEFTKQALKKKFMFECAYSATPEGFTDLRLTVSSKFSPEDFAKEAFSLIGDNQWVRIWMRGEFV